MGITEILLLPRHIIMIYCHHGHHHHWQISMKERATVNIMKCNQVSVIILHPVTFNPVMNFWWTTNHFISKIIGWIGLIAYGMTSSRKIMDLMFYLMKMINRIYCDISLFLKRIENKKRVSVMGMSTVIEMSIVVRYYYY